MVERRRREAAELTSSVISFALESEAGQAESARVLSHLGRR